MPFTPASPPSVATFVVIVAAVLVLFLAGVRRAYPGEPALARRMTLRAGVGLAIWLGLLSAAVAGGVLERLPMSGLPFFFGAVLIVSGWLGLSRLGGRMALHLPLAPLVGFQAFRLPLELVLHRWVELGTIPGTMTWSGQNWDIVSGVVALLAAPLASRSRAAAWFANAVGTILLLNVMRVALLSAPVPFGWGVSPPLVVAFHLPYALIGPVCVGGAFAGHIILTRALLANGRG